MPNLGRISQFLTRPVKTEKMGKMIRSEQRSVIGAPGGRFRFPI